MKIYTRVVMDWDGNVIEEESYDYDGPVAEAKGGGGTSTTVQKADPWSGAQPHLNTIYEDAQGLYESGGPEYYPGQTYINRDPLENMAQQMGLQHAAGGMMNMSSNLQQASNSMLNAPDVANNPYVNAQADVIQNRMNRNLTEQQLPMIRGGAVASGQLGGSRQGIAEGQAIGRTNEATGDALAQLYGDAYSSGLEQQARGVGLMPQSMSATMQPYQTIGEVGAYNRGEQELALQDDMSRHAFEQESPYANLNNYAQIVQGAPWGSTSTSNMAGADRGGFSAGGAMGGAMLGSAFGPIGTVAGGLLGGLF